MKKSTVTVRVREELTSESCTQVTEQEATVEVLKGETQEDAIWRLIRVLKQQS